MERKVFNTEQGGSYNVFDVGEFESTHPLYIYYESIVATTKFKLMFLLQVDFPNAPKEIIEYKAAEAAKEQWKKKLIEIESIELPKKLEDLLLESKKKHQIRLLKPLTVTSDELFKFYMFAGQSGFTMSQYIGEALPSDFDEYELPPMIHLNEDEIVKIGATNLSDLQLKHLIKFRNRTVAKFLDKGNLWHCFYITFKSIAGKESWQGGQAHFHYLSSSFGIPRKDVVDRIRRSDAPSSPVHINISDYGNQVGK